MFNSNGRMCVVVIAFLMCGCAGVPLQQGRSNVDALLQARIEPAQAVPASGSSVSDADRIESQIKLWLAGSLTLESAQRIALLRNPRIRAEYAQLGLTAADVFEAGAVSRPACCRPPFRRRSACRWPRSARC